MVEIYKRDSKRNRIEIETNARRSCRIPESAAPFNNLAHVLAERGRLNEALAAAERAVSLGGPLQPTAQNTLEEIRRKASAGGS